MQTKQKTGFVSRFSWATALAIGGFATWAAVAAPPLPGAIFTTTVDGDVVNGNTKYQDKEDVYLDGGPGPNAPSSAAGLPEGDYYYQVTDPSGQTLLSSDHITCRSVHVNSDGVIDEIYAGTNYAKDKGTYVAETCQHNEGVDIDHPELGAITVQLYPYDDTPNPGGVYKVWMTQVDDYDGDDTDTCLGAKGNCNVRGEDYSSGYFHGFWPAASKTDNYKVKVKGKPFHTPLVTVRKWHDANYDGVWDADEDEVIGWSITVTDPTTVENQYYTQVIFEAPEAGDYTVEEEVPDNVAQTGAILDGTDVSPLAAAVDITVAGTSGETHTLDYGNVGLGTVDPCKVLDLNGDGVADEGEPYVPGWEFTVTGTLVDGSTYGPETIVTDSTGCGAIGDLYPGEYTITEGTDTSGEWDPTGDTSYTITLESHLDGADISGELWSVAYTNIRWSTCDFGTKGYWHNKNGLTEMDDAFVEDYVNALDPYDGASTYFGAGEEPFDGDDGTGAGTMAAVPGWNTGDPGELGSIKAEVSAFLIDSNASGDPREQLAQQLLAFIFNIEYAVGGDSLGIEMPDGDISTGAEVITAAIEAWASGTSAEQTAIKDILDTMNNDDYVNCVNSDPGTPTF